MTMTLRATQRRIWQCLAAPEGVAQFLAAHPRTVLPIRGDARLPAVDRLNIYANMYFYRIRDSLMEDFPALVRAIGIAAFHNLATDYLLRYPSRHWSLRYAGERLPAFLRTRTASRRRAYLPDLARFEWALITAYDAPDAAPLAREVLLTCPPPTWGRLRLRRIPSCILLPVAWPADRIRERCLQETAVAAPAPRSSNAAHLEAADGAAHAPALTLRVRRGRATLLIWRRGLDVAYRRAAPEEARLLTMLAAPTPFATLCRRLARRLGPARAARHAAAHLEQWLADGLVQGPV
ncbi:MAG: putative DNA-binding domain-containing protein [Deltaproteobacteria bacterium]|nr:putative DNA-binding domain-containing protein [Deltaproteobacteria bacterium]